MFTFVILSITITDFKQLFHLLLPFLLRLEESTIKVIKHVILWLFMWVLTFSTSIIYFYINFPLVMFSHLKSYSFFDVLRFTYFCLVLHSLKSFVFDILLDCTVLVLVRRQ